MATIRKRKTTKGTRYQVQIRKHGHNPITKSFSSHRDALTFVKETEAKIERSVYQCGQDAENTIFADLADRYLNEILITKKGYDKERYNIRPIVRALRGHRLSQIRPHVLNRYITERSKQVAPSTIKRELGLISRIMTSAEKDFGIYLPQGNPVRLVRKPKEQPRERRPTAEELEHLTSDKTVGLFVTLAIETGMRRSEILNIQKDHLIGDEGRLLLIPKTKTDTPRTIPLSSEALRALLSLLKQFDKQGAIKPENLSQAFLRACKRHDIEGLRFHDLRHEATSSCNPPEN